MASNIKKIVFPLLFLTLCIIGNSGSKVFLLLAFLTCIVEVFFCDMEETFCFSLFLLPNIRILDDTGISFLVNVIIVLPLVKYFIKRGFYLVTESFIGAILFAVIEGFHMLSRGYWEQLPSEICWLLSFILCVNILLDEQIFIKKETIVYYLSMGIMGSAVVYLLCHQNYARDLLNQVIDGSRFIAYADDPNFYSLYICLCIALLLGLHQKKKIYYLLFAAIVSIGMLTASKMCLLLMSFVVIVYILGSFLSRESDRKEKAFSRNLALMIFIVLQLARDIIVRLINNLLSRAGITNGSGLNIHSVTTGRSTIAYNYILILFNNPVVFLLGAGFQYTEYLGEVTNHGAHNTYLDFVLSWGLIGAIVLIYFIIHIGRCFYYTKCEGLGINELLPLITLLINFLDLGCLNSTLFWFVISVAFLALRREEYMNYDIYQTE